jgi:hypothetical protein
MKRVLTLTVSCLIAIAALAQSPEKMSYQAVIRNSGNQLVVNSTIGMRISILQSSVSGSSVYVETQKPKSNTNGLVTIEIGDGSVVSGTFASIDWSKGPYFIKTETDPTGGTNYTISGTSQLLSVPFALYAKTAGNGFSGNYNDLINKPNIPTNVSQLNNDKGYLSKFTEKDSSITNEIQSLSIRNDTVFLSNSGGFVALPQKVSSTSNSENKLFFESSGKLSSAIDSSYSKYGISYPSTEYRRFSFLVPFDGHIKNLIATPNQNSVATGSKVSVTILINGKPTPLSVSFISTDGFNFKSNNINSIAVKQGDFIAIQYKSSGSVAPGTDFQAIVELSANVGKNEFSHYVGELYGGGIVVSVWIDTSGTEHGLVASLKDLSSGTEWSNISSSLIGNGAKSKFDGRANTNAIVSQSGHVSSAAHLCDTFISGGYNDWYLPSMWELTQCLNAALIVNKTLASSGWFNNDYYWSSTEFNDKKAFSYAFITPGVIWIDKSSTYGVRAVRSY